MKCTIKDVAREAGVSTATVSIVLSGNGKISDQKKEAVTQAINKLGYKRQRVSSKQNQNSVKYVGLIVFCDFKFQWWFTKEFVLTIQERLLELGYYTTLFYTDFSTDPQVLFDSIMEAGVVGVLALHHNDHQFFSRLVSQNMPLVLINNSNHQSTFHTVCADDFQGSYEGTKKLIEMGHTDILYLDYIRELQPATVLDRFFGFRKAKEEAELPYAEDHRIQVALQDEETLFKKLKEILDKDKNITACFIHDDYFALKVLSALEKIGKKVPKDISIIAPGDTLPFQESFIPDISTMQIDESNMGIQAVSMLLEVLKEPDKPVSVLKTIEQYVDRGSCIPLNR